MKKIVVLFMPSYFKDAIEYTKAFVRFSKNVTDPHILNIQYCPDINRFMYNKSKINNIENIKKFIKSNVDERYIFTRPLLLFLFIKEDNLFYTTKKEIRQTETLTTDIYSVFEIFDL